MRHTQKNKKVTDNAKNRTLLACGNKRPELPSSDENDCRIKLRKRQ